MQNIDALKNIGVGERCLLIGGGPSVADFDFSTVPGNVTVIEINFPHIDNVKIDYSLYYDYDVKGFWNEYKDNYPDRQIIGFKTHKGVSDYVYNYEQIVFGDSGFHCLQIADRIMNFTEIYLIGFDYKTNGKTYHYFESESDTDKIDRFKKHSIGKVKDKYNSYPFKNRIYQCTNNTALTKFIYKELV
jgi:hypothetical protein